MAKKIKTIFQNIDKAFNDGWIKDTLQIKDSLNADPDKVIYTADNEADYEKKKLELQQNSYLKERWVRANADLSVKAFNGLNNIKLMYRDVELMDSFPEIGAALDLVAEEACTISQEGGHVINVYSKSDRIKNILEDLFVNRLNLNVTAVSLIRGMCKYGNQYMLLNLDNNLGVCGWRELPPFGVERLENGITNPYGGYTVTNQITKNMDLSTRFTWSDENSGSLEAFRNWQIAHFRLLTDTLYFPYGCLVGDTRVETEYGYKPIKDIQIGDKVWTFNIETQQRELANVTMQMNKGVKDIYHIKTLHFEIKGTEDHKILTYSNKKLIYKEIKDLTIGDLIVCDNLTNRKSKIYNIDKTLPTIEEGANQNMKWWHKNIDFIPDYITTDLARLFGFMLGDGWITKDHHISFALGECDYLNNKYINLLEKFTNHKVSFITNKKDRLKKMVYNACYSRSKTFHIIMKRLGFEGKCYSKRIPSWVFECDNEIKNAFIDGLLDADGYLYFCNEKTINCNIELANENLIRDLKVLVQSLGYKCGNVGCRDRIGYSSTLKDNTKIISRNKTYYLNFNKNLNKPNKRGDIRPRLTNCFKLEKIISIKSVEREETFDITVDNNNSNFFANGIVTHNCSYLNKARRHFRMLSLMEDLMLIYRLDRSVERRVFKIFVGAIDDADVEAYMENIVNQFKRKQLVDPITGQIDLRKNLLNSMDDIFIPIRDVNSQSTIETLPAAQNLTAIDDIKYMQNKVLSALRIPKSFLNFEEAQGDGKNLALMDIRFTRVINRIQQAFLLELTKVATIHLYLLGFEDELTNFTLSMNNPSTQSEQLDTENMQKKILAVRDAVSDPGNGIPIMSLTRALRSIMKWSDKEIQDNFEELRLEKGLSAELEKTSQIIKKTGIFDTVDRIYGEPGAEYQDDNAQQGNDDSGLGSPSGGGGGIGGDLGDIGNSGLEDVSDDTSDVINGNPEETPLGDENQPIENNNKNESTNKNTKLILESNQYNQKENLSDEYHKILNKLIQNKPKGNIFERCELFDKNFLINEEMNEVANNLEKYTK